MFLFRPTIHSSLYRPMFLCLYISNFDIHYVIPSCRTSSGFRVNLFMGSLPLKFCCWESRKHYAAIYSSLIASLMVLWGFLWWSHRLHVDIMSVILREGHMTKWYDKHLTMSYIHIWPHHGPNAWLCIKGPQKPQRWMWDKMRDDLPWDKWGKPLSL